LAATNGETVVEPTLTFGLGWGGLSEATAPLDLGQQPIDVAGRTLEPGEAEHGGDALRRVGLPPLGERAPQALPHHLRHRLAEPPRRAHDRPVLLVGHQHLQSPAHGRSMIRLPR
jgi:hypothetical protein